MQLLPIAKNLVEGEQGPWGWLGMKKVTYDRRRREWRSGLYNEHVDAGLDRKLMLGAIDRASEKEGNRSRL